MSEMNRLEHVAIRVKNLDWYLPFFRDLLKFQITEFHGEESNPSQIWIGGIQLTVDPDFVPYMDAPERVWHIGLNVADVEATSAMVREYPGIETMEEHDNWFRTPDGFVIEFVSK